MKQLIGDVVLETGNLTMSVDRMLNEIEEIRSKLETVGYAWIDGHLYRDLLLWKGATLADLKAIEIGVIHNAIARDPEPTMHFRQVAFHRVILDANNRDELPKAMQLPAVTQIDATEIASEKGAKVFFKRSGTRSWPMPPQAYAQSSVAIAIGKLNSLLHPEIHHPQPNINCNSNAVINDQVTIRINKNLADDEAEATPEGIHQDGTEISSVTLVGRHNIARGGESRIWKLEQPTGNYCSQEFGKIASNPSIPTPQGFDWDNCLLDRALSSPWDTIIFNDRLVKHEARPFFPNGNGSCHRDVIVNFVRKPLRDGSDRVS